MLFQFQYGAIKSGRATILGSRLKLFQFQYGAIKSLESAYLLELQLNFNSNMVRLKE